MKFEIDQIELADVGHPRTLARRIQCQIRDQEGAVPLKFPLDRLAKQVGVISLEPFDSTTIEGMLLVKGCEALVGYNARAKPQRQRFTIAHELGHFLIPTHLAGKIKFECGRKDFNAKRPKKGLLSESVSPEQRKEIEANEFAAELLVPAEEFRSERARYMKADSLLHVRRLAVSFGVSTEMMARVYVEKAEESVAILLSHNGVLKRFILPKHFPFLGLRTGASLPQSSKALCEIKSGRQREAPEPLWTPSEIWFDEDQKVNSVREQTLILSNGWALTMLVVTVESTDDCEDALLKPVDRLWSRDRRGRFSWDS